MTEIKIFVFNPFQENTFVLYDETKECVIIDAGCNNEGEFEKIDTYIKENVLITKAIINTHCHIDHIMGNSYLVEKYKVPSIAHKDDMPLLERSKDMALAFGFDVTEPPVPSKFVEEGEEIKFGNTRLQILHVPGHSPGSIVLYNEERKFMIVGDVLFAGSIGRTDLPGGDHDTLITGIREKIFSLNDDIVVYPGHGESTTVGHEKSTNPYF